MESMKKRLLTKRIAVILAVCFILSVTKESCLAAEANEEHFDAQVELSENTEQHAESDKQDAQLNQEETGQDVQLNQEETEQNVGLKQTEEEGIQAEPYSSHFETDGGEYTLDYILRNYNVFCSGNYEGTHVVGPVVVGGKLALNGALGGTTQDSGDYVHAAPSYVEGYGYNRGDPQNFPRVLTANPDLPLYVGYDNHKQERVQYMPYYYTPEEAYAVKGTAGTPIGSLEKTDSVLNYDDTSRLYVDFNAVFPDAYPEAGGTGGILNGTETLKGSIAYYRDFEGYDAKGHKIDKVPLITNELISRIVQEHNHTFGEWQTTEEGIVHYYRIGMDTEGNECLEEVLDAGEIAEKEYALAIGTTYIGEPNKDKVNVRIRPGYNFSFESLDRIFSFVYVYDDITEMSDSLTIIQTLQSNDVLIPRIYKMIKDDVFGKDYGFGSIEKGPGFSALWLAPNTKKVVAGFKTTEAKAGETNGSKLVGHLAVPQADVILGGGDFNGGIIAHNVDAVTCGSEGHMWPFLAGAGTEAVHIRGSKTVDAHPPEENEIFSFQATLKMKNDAGEYEQFGEPLIVTSDSKGEFEFGYPEDSLEAGEYQITVIEKEEPDSPYKFDTSKYVGTFIISAVPEGEAVPPAKITWMKYSGESDTKGEPYKGKILRFDNTTKKELTVKKEWKDTDGNPMTEYLPEQIQVSLYRDSTVPEGHPVVLEIYSGNHATPGECNLTERQVLGYMKDGGRVSFQVTNNQMYDFGTYKYAYAGVFDVQMEETSIFDTVDTEGCITQTQNPYYQTVRVEADITGDTVIKVYYFVAQPYNDGTYESTGEMFDVTTTGTIWEEPPFEPLEEHLYQTVTLNAENNWSYTWTDLPPRDGKGRPYYYKVVENDPVSGFDVTYSNNCVLLNRTESDVITVTNSKKPIVTTVELPETGGTGTIKWRITGILLLGVCILNINMMRYERQRIWRRKVEK